MVYVTGDMHGDPTRLHDRALRRLKKGDTLLVCGDFGYIWKGDEAERRLLKKWGKRKYTVAFLDGAHENFDRLDAFPVSDWNGGRVQVIGGNLLHLLRGEVYTLEGKTYFVLGGSEEPEREMRQSANTWFEREMPTEQELRHAIERLTAHGGRVNYMITHEPSAKVGGQLITRTRELNGVHLFLSLLEETVQFDHWYFGALHMDKPVSRRHTAVFRRVLPVDPPPKRR